MIFCADFVATSAIHNSSGFLPVAIDDGLSSSSSCSSPWNLTVNANFFPFGDQLTKLINPFSGRPVMSSYAPMSASVFGNFPIDNFTVCPILELEFCFVSMRIPPNLSSFLANSATGGLSFGLCEYNTCVRLGDNEIDGASGRVTNTEMSSGGILYFVDASSSSLFVPPPPSAALAVVVTSRLCGRILLLFVCFEGDDDVNLWIN